MKKTLPLITHVRKLEEHLNQQYNHAVLAHLKNQIIKKTSNGHENYGREINVTHQVHTKLYLHVCHKQKR